MTEAQQKLRVAIIMPVLNEEKYLASTLDQIYMQDFPMDQVEVVIADGGSTDRTREIARSFKGRFGSLRILDSPRGLASAGRNLGVRNSVAPYIMILDGHTYLPSKTLLSSMVDLFESTDAQCLCRPQPLTPPDLGAFERTVAVCRESRLGHNPGSDIFSEFEGQVDPTSSGAMYRRSVFDAVGYFDEEFDACEDVDLNYRVHEAGLKALISPKLKVCYYPRSSLAGLFMQMMRYGRGRFNMFRKHRDVSPLQLLAALAVAGLALLLLLAPISDTAWSYFRTLTGLYILLVVGFGAYLAQKESSLSCLLIGPLVFPMVHFGLGFGFLHGAWDHYTRKQPPPPRPPDMDLS
jgi:GT2 family glycosyltransferase